MNRIDRNFVSFRVLSIVMRRILLLFFFHFLSNGMVSAAEEQIGIKWEKAKYWHSLKPISFRVQEFPDDIFLLIFPEWLTSREKSWHVRPTWKTEGSQAFAEWVSDGISVKLKMDYQQCKKQSALKWTYQVSNESEQDLTDVALFNCFNLVDAPMFVDREMTHTWIRKGEKNTVQLSTVKRTTASRTIQFYPAKGGLTLPEFERFMRYGATSTQELAGDRIAVDSKDGNWTVESIVDGQVAYFFNNWEPTHGCIHAAPLLGDIPTGKAAYGTGSIVIKPRKH
jgi:hypothetical protein